MLAVLFEILYFYTYKLEYENAIVDLKYYYWLNNASLTDHLRFKWYLQKYHVCRINYLVSLRKLSFLIFEFVILNLFLGKTIRYSHFTLDMYLSSKTIKIIIFNVQKSKVQRSFPSI